MDALDVALRLINMLMERRQISAEDIIEEFGVSRATAFRYMDKLKNNFFLNSKDAKDGIYTINRKYDHKKSALQKSEADFFSSLIDDYSNPNSEEEITRPYMLISNKPIDSSSVQETRRIVHSCITTMEKCSFLYCDNKNKFIVEPYKIIYTDNLFYMLSKHNDRAKTFRLDHMKQVIKTGEVFIPDKKIIKDYDNAKTIWHNPDEAQTITMDIRPEAAHYFKELQILPEQKIIKEFKNDSIRIEFKSSSVMEFQKLLLGWFGSFENVSPKQYAEHVESLIQKYKGEHETKE